MSKNGHVTNVERMNALLQMAREVQSGIDGISQEEAQSIMDLGLLADIRAIASDVESQLSAAIDAGARELQAEAAVEIDSSSVFTLLKCDDLSKLSLPVLKQIADHLFYLYILAKTNAQRYVLLKDIEKVRIEIFSKRNLPMWEEPAIDGEIPLPAGVMVSSAYSDLQTSILDTEVIEKPELFFKQPVNPYDGYYTPDRIKQDQERVCSILRDLTMQFGSGSLFFAIYDEDRDSIDAEIAKYSVKFKAGMEEIVQLAESYSLVFPKVIKFLEDQKKMIEEKKLYLTVADISISDDVYLIVKERIVDQIFDPELEKLRRMVA